MDAIVLAAVAGGLICFGVANRRKMNENGNLAIGIGCLVLLGLIIS